MKTTIYRVYENEVVDICRSFYERRFLDHQLSRTGRWSGREAQLLKLPNPVSFAAIFNLFLEREAFDVLSSDETRRAILTGKAKEGTINAGTNLAGWKMIFNAGEVLATVWALGHKAAQKRLNEAHSNSVEMALMQLQNRLEADLGFKRWQPTVRPIFAAYFAGADRQQCPCVHTSVLIPRRHLSHDGNISEISEVSLEKAHRQVEEVYSNSVKRLFGNDENMNLPRSSLQATVPGNKGNERFLLSGHLFSEWRKLAREAGQNAIEATANELKALGFEEIKTEEDQSLGHSQAPLAMDTNRHHSQSNRHSHSH